MITVSLMQSGARRPTGSATAFMLVVVYAVLLGCSSGSSATTTTTPLTSHATPPPRPRRSTVSSGQPTSATPTPTASTTTSESTPAPVTGTVVPFRTVAPGSAVGKRFGLVSPAGTDPFGKAVTDSVVTQVDAAGAQLIRCDPGDDEALVLDCARRMTTQQVDGWIAVQPGDLGEALCEAGPPNVPLIVIAAAPVSCQTAVCRRRRSTGRIPGRELAGPDLPDSLALRPRRLPHRHRQRVGYRQHRTGRRDSGRLRQRVSRFDHEGACCWTRGHRTRPTRLSPPQ